MEWVAKRAAISLISLGCCFPQAALVVAAAQKETRVEAAGTAKTGLADGERSPALTEKRRPLYRLQKSDVVEISFTFSPEFNQTVTVQPDGLVSLKGTAAIDVEGMTLAELNDALVKAYGSTLHDPQINLVLKDFNKPYFIATGEVTRPGRYELRGETTISEALAISGGFTNQAKHSQVVLFRKISNELTEVKLINIKRMMNARDLREDARLKTGDFIFVPQNRISKIKKYLPGSALSMYWNATQF